METRKVQFVGGSTYSLSLPKNWATKAGIKVGDEIEFEPLADGTLNLRLRAPSEPVPRRAHVVDASSMSVPDLERMMIALYVAGHDHIEVATKGTFSAPVRESLNALPRHLAGLEVVEETPAHLSFQVLVDSTEFDVPRAFDRIYAVASSLHRDVLVALAEQDPSRLDGHAVRGADVERLALLAMRHQRVASGGRGDVNLTHNDALTYCSAIADARQIGRHGAFLGRAVHDLGGLRLDPRIRSGLVEIGSRALQVCDEAARAVSKGDAAAADSACAKSNALEGRISDFRNFAAGSAAQCGECAQCLRSLPVVEWMHATALTGADLARLGIDRALHRENAS